MLIFNITVGLFLMAGGVGDTTGYRQYETEDVEIYRDKIVFSYPALDKRASLYDLEVNPNRGNHPDTGAFEPGLHIEEPGGVTHLQDIHIAPVGDEMDGYRIQIYAGPDLEKANNTTADFVEQFSSIKTYRLWVQPTFRVRCGNYVSKGEATAFCNELRKYFPQAFVVKDRIKIPRYKPSGTSEQDSIPDND